ncbi:hypothetical protein GHT09_009551 [Marmota monax]|uniref:Uncharacterized protein n=1 Tax=Marmota monax TaxID=9995 RepID=A0A834QJS7_MARMO|nr:hypothetical protein GHT09_009551 [Marmota monax]
MVAREDHHRQRGGLFRVRQVLQAAAAAGRLGGRAAGTAAAGQGGGGYARGSCSGGGKDGGWGWEHRVRQPLGAASPLQVQRTVVELPRAAARGWQRWVVVCRSELCNRWGGGRAAMAGSRVSLRFPGRWPTANIGAAETAEAEAWRLQHVPLPLSLSQEKPGDPGRLKGVCRPRMEILFTRIQMVQTFRSTKLSLLGWILQRKLPSFINFL